METTTEQKSCDATASGTEQAVCVVYLGTRSLYLCAHHWAKHEAALRRQGAVYVPIVPRIPEEV